MSGAATKPAQAIQPRYLDAEAAAVYLGMTATALYKSAQRRLVPYRKKGKRLVFDVAELDAYMHQLEGVDVGEAVSRALNGGTMKALAN